MLRIELPRSALASFPFRLLPHFHITSEDLEKTLDWELQFQNKLKLPSIADATIERTFLSKESLNVQSCPVDKVGEYLLVTEANTILHPSCLFILKKQLRKTKCNLVYWDECSYDLNNQTLVSYFRKGQPSNLSFLGRNVIGSSAVVSKELWEKFANSQLSLAENIWRISLESNSALHIPLSLSAIDAKNEQAYKEISLSIGLKLASVTVQTVTMRDGKFGSKPEIKLSPINEPIGIVIPFKNEAQRTLSGIASIAKQSGSDSFHLRIISNNSTPEERAKVEAALITTPFKSSAIIDDLEYFNYARLNNRGIQELLEIGCRDLVLMNNDVMLKTGDFLLQAQAWSRLSNVGLVGGTLFYPSGSVQSAGINFSQVRPANVSGDNMHADKLREVDGLCFAAVLIRDTAMNALGGALDEIECPNGYGDTLFCQKAREKGFLSLHVPWLEATHYESASRGVRPEELELLELVQNGLRISDLWSDLEAERQPMVIPLGPTSGAFQAVVRQVSSSRRLLAIAEALCKPIVRIGKALRQKFIGL